MQASTPRRGQNGFTLVEILVTIAIAALLLQIVTMNLGALIPSRAMDSTAAQIVAKIDFLRSEARLQGKTYKLELDLDNHRHRMILPGEDRLVSTKVVQESFELGWIGLDERVHFAGCTVAGGTTFRNGSYPVVFDENGFTADQAIFLVHAKDEQLVWTIQIHGLTGQARVVSSMEGVQQPLEKMEEGRF